MKRDLLASPVDTIADTIGDINLAISCQPNKVDGAHAEAGVMSSHHGIMVQRGLKLLRTRDSAGYDGIWINRAAWFGDGKVGGVALVPSRRP